MVKKIKDHVKRTSPIFFGLASDFSRVFHLTRHLRTPICLSVYLSLIRGVKRIIEGEGGPLEKSQAWASGD